MAYRIYYYDSPSSRYPFAAKVYEGDGLPDPDEFIDVPYNHATLEKFLPAIPIYKKLSDYEVKDLTTAIKSAKEISDFFKILQGCDEQQLKEKVIMNIINEVNKIKSTSL